MRNTEGLAADVAKMFASDVSVARDTRERVPAPKSCPGGIFVCDFPCLVQLPIDLLASSAASVDRS